MNALSPSLETKLQPNGLMSLWDMLEIDGSKFVSAMQAMITIEAALSAYEGDELNEIISLDREDDKKIYEQTILVLIVSCVALGAKYTAKAAIRLQKLIEEKRCSYGEMKRLLRDIRDRFRDELDDAKLFGINASSAKFYDKVPSASVQEAFPRSCFDLIEAGKCIALDRSTAAVLHLMRALEPPLSAMAAGVDVPLKDNWNTILNDIENKVRGKDEDGSRTKYWAGRKEEQAFFADASNVFFHIKNA